MDRQEESQVPGLLLPGTILLIDKSGTSEAAEGKDGVLLIPQPSQEPNDPLNWSPIRKYWHIFITLLWAFFIQCAAAWTGPAWALWNEELGLSYTTLNNGVGCLIFLCGLSIAFVVPWALKFGRRATYTFGSALTLAGLAFGLAMRTQGFYYAYAVLLGVGSSPSYSVNEISLLDITFVHQRGTVLGLYAIALALGTVLSPIAAGYIVSAQGWRWCFRYLLMFFGVTAVVLFLTGEETLYVRPASNDILLRSVSNQADIGQTRPSAKDANQAVRATSHSPHGNLESLPGDDDTADRHTSLGRYLCSMTLWRRDTHIHMSYFRLVWTPFLLLKLPAVVWAGVMVGLGTFWSSLVIVTQASIFSIPPYSFNSSTMGLMYFGLVIGALFGMAWGGPLHDATMYRLASRRNGIHEAEDRLWTFLPLPLTCSAGVLLWGVCGAYGVHWSVPCAGLVLIGFSLTASFSPTMGYAFDCYPALAGETVHLSNVVRNLIGGVFTFAIQPWISVNGIRDTSIIIAILGFVLNGTVVIFLWKGKAIRKRTRGIYLGLVDQVLVVPPPV